MVTGWLEIAFLAKSENAKYEIFIINPDGSELTNLTNDPDHSKLRRWHPQWQPIRKPMNIPLSKMDGETIREAAAIGNFIPGRSIDDIVLNLEENDFECNMYQDDPRGWRRARCQYSAGTLEYFVQIFSQSPDQFDRITASIREHSDTITENSISDFLSYAATLALLGQPEIQELMKEELVNIFNNNGVGWEMDISYGDLDFNHSISD